MPWILLVLFILPFKTWSQDFLNHIQDLQEKVGENQLDSYLENPQKEGLPGDFIGTLLPKSPAGTDLLCDEEMESKKTHYEVVLVAKGSSQLSEFEILPGQKANFRTLDLQFLIKNVPSKVDATEFKTSSITERAKEIWNSGYFATPTKDFDPHSSLGQELLIESLVHAGASSSLSEANLSKEMAGVLGSVYTTRDERYNALSALSLRLYRNYNNARNPGYDNPKNNPFGYELPKGDQNLNGLLKAASDFNVFEGGVCNDISEVVAQIGEHLFPNDDVLTVNSGTHFGVLVTDGKETRVIDGGTQFSMSNQLLLDPNLSSTNLRISKVVNGEQREIAVVDTQVGQVMEGAFETGKHLLKTDVDISSVYAHLKKNNFGVSAGVASLTDSQVVVVVAKYETSGEKWKTFLGAGLSGQTFNSDQESKYQVHFRAGAERNIFSYVNSQTQVNFASGVRLGGMYALNQPKNELGGVGRVDMSLNFDFYNRLNLNYTPLDPNGVRVRSYVEVEQTLGPTNWGNTTGALSYTEASDTGTLLKNISFHLNQVNADLSVEKNLSSNVTGFANTHYQGSNIGQSVSVLAGLNIRAPAGAQIIVFSGYTDATLSGYKSQHSLLGTPSGPEIGTKYITKKGTEFSAGMKSTDRGSLYQATIKIPLGKKK